MPDPLTIATQYGLPWGIVTGLAIVIGVMYKNTVPNHVYDAEVERNKELAKAVQSLVSDVHTLLVVVNGKGGISDV
jgi:hypothetical protein